MNNKALVWIFALAALAFAFFASTKADAASYDVKEVPAQVVTKAAKVSISTDKVMNGITDITINAFAGKTTERYILQCDATTQTLNVFYFLKDTTGGKAKGATGFAITVYDNDDQVYTQGGKVEVFDGQNTKVNLRKALDRLLQLKGVGYIVFEFYENVDGIGRSPVAYSLQISSKEVPHILQAIDAVQGSEGCNIDGGFTSVHSLKNLTDSF